MMTFPTGLPTRIPERRAGILERDARSVTGRSWCAVIISFSLVNWA